jgi:hypothetical protein
MFEGERSGEPRWAWLAQRVRDVATACAAGSLERLRVVDGDVEIEVRRGAAAPSARSVAAGTDAPAFEPPSRNGDPDGRAEPALVRSDVVASSACSSLTANRSITASRCSPSSADRSP